MSSISSLSEAVNLALKSEKQVLRSAMRHTPARRTPVNDPTKSGQYVGPTTCKIAEIASSSQPLDKIFPPKPQILMLILLLANVFAVTNRVIDRTSAQIVTKPI